MKKQNQFPPPHLELNLTTYAFFHHLHPFYMQISWQVGSRNNLSRWRLPIGIHIRFDSITEHISAFCLWKGGSETKVWVDSIARFSSTGPLLWQILVPVIRLSSFYHMVIMQLSSEMTNYHRSLVDSYRYRRNELTDWQPQQQKLRSWFFPFRLVFEKFVELQALKKILLYVN